MEKEEDLTRKFKKKGDVPFRYARWKREISRERQGTKRSTKKGKNPPFPAVGRKSGRLRWRKPFCTSKEDSTQKRRGNSSASEELSIQSENEGG